MIDNTIQKTQTEKEFLRSQNAILRVGIQSVNNEVLILKNGNVAVEKECLKMIE